MSADPFADHETTECARCGAGPLVVVNDIDPEDALCAGCALAEREGALAVERANPRANRANWMACRRDGR